MLHLGFEDPRRPGAGGGSVRVHEINRRLAAHFDITVVCARYPGCSERIEDGVRYRHVGLPLGYFGSLLTYFLAIPWVLWSDHSELVVEDFAAPFSSVAVPWITRRPVIGVVQWLFAREKAEQYRVPFNLIEDIGLRSHRELIAVSSDLADQLRRRNPTAEVTVISNGLDDEAFKPRSLPRSNSLFLGRLEIAQKGLDLLIDAFARVADATDSDLVLAGDGPDEAAVKELVTRRGLGARVRFHGRAPSDTRFDLLAGADVVVMPSRYETFGMVAAESLAVGTPVVAFDIPCLRNLVDDFTNGVLVAPFDVEGFAESWVKLLTDANLRRRLGDAGPQAVAALHWDALAELQAEVYLRVMAGSRQSPVAAPPA